TRPAGGTWAASQPLSAPGQDAADVRVATDSGGDALATWQRSDGANVVIQASYRPAGGAWSTPITLSAAGQDAYHARAALDDRGDAALVAWGRSDGGHTIVQAAELPAGGTWSAPVDLSKPGRSAYEQQVAMDGAGDAVVLWQRSDGGYAR